MVFTAK